MKCSIMLHLIWVFIVCQSTGFQKTKSLKNIKKKAHLRPLSTKNIFFSAVGTILLVTHMIGPAGATTSRIKTCTQLFVDKEKLYL